jgi:hypothetical protein
MPPNMSRKPVWIAAVHAPEYVIGREFGYRLLLRYGSYVGLTTGRIKLGQYLFLRYNLCAPARGSTDRASRARDARPAEVALGSRLLPFHADGQRTAASESRNVGLTAHRSSGRLLCRLAHAVSLRLLK